LNLSARLISHGTVFFSHNKTAPAGLSAAKTISRTASKSEQKESNDQQNNFHSSQIQI